MNPIALAGKVIAAITGTVFCLAGHHYRIPTLDGKMYCHKCGHSERMPPI